MLAIKDVAKYLNIQLAITWTPRCSSPGELVADMLSKAKFEEASKTAERPINLSRVPRSLLRWLEAPRVTRLLGMAILEEFEGEGSVCSPGNPRTGRKSSASCGQRKWTSGVGRKCESLL